MMENTSHSPQYLRGALIAFYPDNNHTRVTTFQLNPDAIQRDIIPLDKKIFAFKTAGVRERISFDLSIDALLGDGYFDENDEVNPDGVAGFLSSLELLLYPAKVSNGINTSSSGGSFLGIFDLLKILFGSIRYKPLPLISLVFGEHRIVPVRITKMRITEQAFDTKLNPVRASVHIVMDVLTEQESRHHQYVEALYNNYLKHKVLSSERLIFRSSTEI